MNVVKPLAFAVAAVTGSLTCAPAFASPIWQQNLNFNEQNQSMWSSGPAFQPSYNHFFGTSWNKSTTFGGFTGGISTIKTQTAASVAAIAAWYTCEGGSLGLANCGSKPAPQYKYSTIDTRTGIQVSASTSGTIGFTVGFTMNSGSLNSSPTYTPQIKNLPTTVSAGQLVKLNTSGGSAMTSGKLSSQFPSVTASLSTTLQFSASANGQACLVGACQSFGVSTGSKPIGGTQQLVSFNSGGITWFGGSGNLYDAVTTAANLAGQSLPTGLPATFNIPASKVSSLGQVTVDYPQPTVSGTLNTAGTEITGSGSSQAISATLDLPNLITTAFESPVGLNGTVTIGGGASLTYNLLSVDTGPTIGLTQTFDLTPTLYADLKFSKPVNVTGHGLVTQVDGLDWNNLPSMIFGPGVTTVTPSFYLGTDLNNLFSMNSVALDNQLALALGGTFDVSGLSATFTTPVDISVPSLGINNGSFTFGLGSLYSSSFNLFTTPPIFSANFPLGGYSPISGQSFAITAAALSNGGGGPTTVPDPSTPALLAAGLLALVTRQRRKSGARAR